MYVRVGADDPPALEVFLPDQPGRLLELERGADVALGELHLMRPVAAEALEGRGQAALQGVEYYEFLEVGQGQENSGLGTVNDLSDSWLPQVLTWNATQAAKKTDQHFIAPLTVYLDYADLVVMPTSRWVSVPVKGSGVSQVGIIHRSVRGRRGRRAGCRGVDSGRAWCLVV